MSYMVVYARDNVHDLHLHYREYQFLTRRNGTFFCDERITKYMLYFDKIMNFFVFSNIR